jgi:hypothetical protein
MKVVGVCVFVRRFIILDKVFFFCHYDDVVFEYIEKVFSKKSG